MPPHPFKVALDIKNLHKSFYDNKALQGVSFQLFENEVLALFGNSGTGKTLILRCIIGLECPDQGHIYYKNQDLPFLKEHQLRKIRTKISYVFQYGALFDSLTVEENLAYPLKEHTRLPQKQIDEQIRYRLKRIGLPHAGPLLPAELSGGMQKRVGLARSMMLNPEIVLFDEPTAGLDPSNTKRIIQNIFELKKQKLTAIFVTHDIPSALKLADRIAFLDKGKIAYLGTLKQVKQSDDPLVRSFLKNDTLKNTTH